jgi:hypothetical protein
MPETGLSGLEGGARFKPSFLPLSPIARLLSFQHKVCKIEREDLIGGGADHHTQGRVCSPDSDTSFQS